MLACKLNWIESPKVNSAILNVEYRPIRVGFCLRAGDIQSVVRAMEYAHTIWGGRFCPIIPIDNFTYAQQLVDAFDVDALFPVTSDPTIQEFLQKFEHIQ